MPITSSLEETFEGKYKGGILVANVLNEKYISALNVLDMSSLSNKLKLDFRFNYVLGFETGILS